MADELDQLLADHPDRSALSRIGARLRARLNADPRAVQLHADKAEIWTIDGFLGDEECDRLIALVDQAARPSPIYFAEEQRNKRTSYSGDLPPRVPLVIAFQQRLDAYLGMDPASGELFQGQRYQIGQEFRLHTDWFRPDAAYWNRESCRGGQRSVTAMFYLNDVAGGGATSFPGLNLSVTPRRGTMLVWNNAHADGMANRWTAHAAEPVTAGTKYVITKWYRCRSMHGG